MMAYLPEKEGPRDLVMCVGGDVLSVTLSQIAFYFDWNVLGFVMNCLGFAYFGAYYWTRLGVRYRFEQHLAKKLADKNVK